MCRSTSFVGMFVMVVGSYGGVGELAAQDRISVVCQPTQTTAVPRFVLDVDFANRTVRRRPSSEAYPASFTTASIRYQETYRGRVLWTWEIDRTTGDMYAAHAPDSVQATCQQVESGSTIGPR